MDWKVKHTKDAVIIKAQKGNWNAGMDGKTLCKLKNTGNGYIAKFPSHSTMYQEYYACLDYAQASDLLKALVISSKQLLDDEEREYLIDMLKMDQVG